MSVTTYERPELLFGRLASRFIKFFPYLILFGASIIGYRNALKWLLGIGFNRGHGFSPYVYWIYRVNYLNSGFVRRGLGATILALFDRGAAQSGMAGLALVSIVFLCIPLGLLLSRLIKKGGSDVYWLGMLLLVSPQLFRWWGGDPGHCDMMTSGFIAWALLATLDRRYALASMTLLVGFLNHEAAVIMGAPLCACFWFLDWRERETTPMQGGIALLILGAGLVAILALQHAFGPSPRQIALSITSGPASDNSAWLRAGNEDARLVAGYTTAGGFRAAATSICSMAATPGAFVLPLFCFVSLALYVVIYPLRSRLGVNVFLVACLLPMTFLSITAIDYGRWLALSVMNGWLATAALRIRGLESEPRSVRSYVVAGFGLVLLLAGGAGNTFSSGMRIMHLGKKVYGKTFGDPVVYTAVCDPQWKAVALGAVTAK